MRKRGIYLLILLWILAACRATPTRPPLPTSPLPRPTPARLAPTHRPSPTRPAGTTIAHFPWMGQHSAPTETPSTSPTPTPPLANHTPSPTPSERVTPTPARYVHIPLVFGNPPLHEEEPLAVTGHPFAVIVDASAFAAQTWDGHAITRWEAQQTIIPRVLTETLPDAQIAVQRMGGEAPACEENTQTLLPMHPVSAISWEHVWHRVRPAGPVPLAEALLRAANTFPAGSLRPLLLITAANHVCGEDPCNVARVLERADADVTVHVIDISDTDEGKSVLRCIAEATGGTYAHATTPHALETSMRTAIHHALGGQLRVEVVGANGQPLFPAVVVGRGDQIVRTFDAWTDADLAQGTYTVTVGTPLPSIFENVVIHPGQRTKLHIPLGELHLHLVDAQHRPIFAEISLSTPSLGTFFGSEGETIVVPLPTGYYTASVILETFPPLAFARNVPVVVGSVTDRTVRVPVTRLQVELTQRGQPSNGFITLSSWASPDIQIAGGWANGNITFLVPAGWYQLRISQYADPQSVHALTQIHVEDPAHTSDIHHVHYVDTGTLRILDTASDGAPVRGWVHVYPSRRSSPVLFEGPVPTQFTLPTGTYDVHVIEENGRHLWAWDVVIQPQQHVDVTLLRPQARVWIQASTPWGEPRVAHTVLYREPEHTPVLNVHTPWRAILPPGTYQAELNEYSPVVHTTLSEPFTVQEGDTYTLTVSLPLASLTLRPDNVDELDVHIYSQADQTTPLGHVRSGLPRLLLPAGNYAFHLQDVDNPERHVWIREIHVNAGERQEITVHFPAP